MIVILASREETKMVLDKSMEKIEWIMLILTHKQFRMLPLSNLHSSIYQKIQSPRSITIKNFVLKRLKKQKLEKVLIITY